MPCLLVACYMAASAAGDAPRPNIVFVVTDDQSPMTWSYDGGYRAAEAFGYNGDDRVHTPEIDRLANEGIIFSRAYVSSTVCSPSRYSTLTGRYAGRCTGTDYMALHPPGTLTRTENNTELELDRPSLPKLLQASGYRTGWVGKSHIVNHHALRSTQWPAYGLQSYDQTADPNDPNITTRMVHNHDYWRRWLSAYGFDYVDGVYAANLKELHNDALNVHNLEWTTNTALQFIESADEEPFFLYYATTVPHGPAPWIRSDGRYIRSLDADPRMTGAGYHPLNYDFMPTRAEILQTQSDLGKPAASAWVHWFDSAIGALRTKLEQKGLWENTLFIVTSDHGSWRHGKATLHEGGLRVPLVMHWPTGIDAPFTYNGLVQNIDFAPTFLELAGITLPAEMHSDGVSLAPVLGGSTNPLRSYLFAELGFARGIVTDSWKYIAVRYTPEINAQIANGETFPGWQGAELERPYLTRNSHLGHFASTHNANYFDGDQLYDLDNDPREEVNLFGTDPNKAAEMQALLTTVLNTFEDRPFGEFVQGSADPNCVGLETFVDFGDASSSNLVRKEVGDGNMTTTSIGGRTCITPVNPAQDHYVYLAIDDAIAYNGNEPTICVYVDYYDSGAISMNVQYEALDGTKYKGTANHPLTDTNQWLRAIFTITDAKLGNGQNGQSDLRLRFTGTVPFYVERVGVVIPPSAAPAELRVDASSVGCIANADTELQENLFTVTNTGGGTLNFQVLSDKAWLTPIPSSASSGSGGSVPVGVHVDTANLALGEHTATLTVIDDGESTARQDARATVLILPATVPDCTLVTSPGNLSYVIAEGSSLPTDVIGVYGLSASDSICNLDPNVSWITPASTLVYANATEYVPVNYHVESLAPADYFGQLTLSSPTCPGSDNALTVNVRILSAEAWLLDVDEDGDIDAEDVNAVTQCLSGPDVDVTGGGCSDAPDVDGDLDFDLADFGRMQACSAGEGGYPTCD